MKGLLFSTGKTVIQKVSQLRQGSKVKPDSMVVMRSLVMHE